MRTAVCVLSLLACAWSMPSNSVRANDWSRVKPVESFRETLPDAKPADVSGRIAGGTEAVPHSLPYVVAVLVEGFSICGGSLISTEWVLTAAHCTTGASFALLILGAHNVENIEPTQVEVISTLIINHPQYDPSILANDICLIHLPSPVTLTNAIHVIPLAPFNAESFEGSTGVLSGWGSPATPEEISPVLLRVDVDIISNAECRDNFGDIVIESTICSSGAGGVGACSGDSGGPLVVNNTQVGVVSFGSGLCDSGLPTGYVRVSELRSWIFGVSGV